MNKNMKIGQLAKATGLTTKTIRHYELHRLLEDPERTESGYRMYGEDDVQRLEFVKKAKRLGLSLEEIREILVLHEQSQAPCVHVLALLDRKLEQVEGIIRELEEFRRELMRLKVESQVRLEQVPEDERICGIIERGVHHRGELALTWLEGRQMSKSDRGTS